MIKACVIGYPLGYSLSPVIHGYWFRQYGIDGSYEALKIEPGALDRDVRRLRDEGYAGFNVTIPYKEDMRQLCQVLDDAARAIGAVNTVCIKSGMLEGRNTDAFGFAENLRHHAPDLDWGSTRAVVLGAGGAARAIVYALRQGGIDGVTIINRSFERAAALANAFTCDAAPWEDREDLLAGCSLLVNATALGMTGKDALALNLSPLPARAVVYDIVYAPLMTPLLHQARLRGCKIVTGIGMLLHQARPAFEAWTGVMPDVTPELEQLVLRQAA